MCKKQIGVIGMGVMGRNLALNLESHGYTVSIFNRSLEKMHEVINDNPGKKLVPYFSLTEFVNSLESPRYILLMIQAGKATDDTISSLIPLLKKGDILIDGGNSYYKDTMRRNTELLKYGIDFIGTGISGGEDGALHGPSIMPGGRKEAYELIEPIFKKIAARTEDGEECIMYIGPNGAGHYVKMVHNGIEYSDMQQIAEVYSLLKNVLHLKNDELAKIFDDWNKGELKSYLIEITKNIFTKKNKKDKYVLDLILDIADNKGTGIWMCQSALELNQPLSLITEAVFSRYLSSMKSQRIFASKILQGPNIKNINIIDNKYEFIEKIRQSLYLGKIIAYSQGFAQLYAASEHYHWNLNLACIAKIFRAGCIIRAEFLKKITKAYLKEINIINLLLIPYFKDIANKYQQSLRDVVSCAVQIGIPVPTLSASLAYYDSVRSEQLPANLIQAQRDFFGAHTYQRIDKKGIYHTQWCSIEE